MKISELIAELEKAKKECGDVECLVEVLIDYNEYEMVAVEKLRYVEKSGYGLSVEIMW